jgi:hypothetical protein
MNKLVEEHLNEFGSNSEYWTEEKPSPTNFE